MIKVATNARHPGDESRRAGPGRAALRDGRAAGVSIVHEDGTRADVPRGRALSPQEIRRARDLAFVRLKASGVRTADVARIFGVSRQWVNRRVKQVPPGARRRARRAAEED